MAARLNPALALRKLDELPYKIVQQNGTAEVWVEYKNFYTGRSDQCPIV